MMKDRLRLLRRRSYSLGFKSEAELLGGRCEWGHAASIVVGLCCRDALGRLLEGVRCIRDALRRLRSALLLVLGARATCRCAN
jgi:hypothetical protein